MVQNGRDIVGVDYRPAANESRERTVDVEASGLGVFEGGRQ